MTRSGVWSCAIAAMLFGASTPAASVIAQDMQPLVLAGLLYLGAAVAVAPWWIARRPRPSALRREWRLLAVAIVAGGAVGPSLLTAGLVDTPAATASLLLNLELVATVLLAATLFREHLGRNMVAAAALVTTAGVLLVWQPGASIKPGALLIVGACACWGLDNSVTSRIDQLSPQHVVFLKGIVAGSVNLALGLLVSGAGEVDGWSVIGALTVGALGYGASITLWVRGAQQLGAARGQVIFATAPFLGAVLAWVVLSDSLELMQLIALATAALGVALSLRTDHVHRHHHHATAHTHEHSHDDAHHEHSHPDGPLGRHSHSHEHREVAHDHPHVPDLHHRHDHKQDDETRRLS
ncbi:MAG TPA: DMT family transporter [Ilumatobacter sp.]|nr:DMT family transporter [Ilumatobacter sp.]